MDPSPTVSTLFTRYQKRLGLHWITGEETTRTLVLTTEAGEAISLVGHLNIIHPNRLQVVGQQELAHLDNLTPEARQALISQLFAARPAALFVADGLQIPEDVLLAAQAAEIALIGTAISSNKLINSLRYYLGSELAEKTTIHGVFLEVSGLGVLLTGESSVGKSELALELITRNHRLIADDAPEFSHVGPDTVRGTCPEVLRDFLEVRGLGVLNIRAMYGDSAIKLSKDLHLIVNLKNMASEDMHLVDRLKGSYRTQKVFDIDIPEVTLPVASGRNLAVLVEAAVRHHILLRKGYNASEAFIKRQSKLLQQNTSA